MGIDQLGFQSVQLGYLKILQMGNTDPNNTKAGKRTRENRSSRPANQLAVITVEPLYPHSVSIGEIIGAAIAAYTNYFLTGHGTHNSRDFPGAKIQKLKRAEELSGLACENVRATLLLRVPPHCRLRLPNWYQSKELLKTSSTPPVSLQNGRNRRQFTGEVFE
ncbi:hypothetical protein F511_32144 [Dorcoceras hygrometricum]|uniref:Uncharacterized protein n=1 Tax=Dorcoceras hygrometricum TaxID=472368 RepID=A0A2Z7D8A5_9LAMI|nr:hypothetical protein F511_32144 [Dorcoceras hygrometricum]